MKVGNESSWTRQSQRIDTRIVKENQAEFRVALSNKFTVLIDLQEESGADEDESDHRTFKDIDFKEDCINDKKSKAK